MKLFSGPSCYLTDVRHAVEDNGLTLIIHGPYVYNLASEDDTKFRQAFGMLKKMMDSASIAGAKYVVNHVGSGSLEKVERICSYIVEQGYSAKLLLENDSGSKNGTRVGSIGNIRSITNKIPGVGFVLILHTLMRMDLILRNTESVLSR